MFRCVQHLLWLNQFQSFKTTWLGQLYDKKVNILMKGGLANFKN